MKGIFTASLGLLLALLTSAARCQEPIWHPTGTKAPVTLDRPQPMNAARPLPALPAYSDPYIAPVSYDAKIRAKDTDEPKRLSPDDPIFNNVKAQTDSTQPPAGDKSSPEVLPGPKTKSTDAAKPRAPLDWEGACGADGCGDSCGVCATDCCCPDVCCPCPICCSNCLWFRAEYLSWRIRQGPAPALVTTGTASGGLLGAPDTTILFGGPIDYEERSGGRFTIGYWFDPCQTYGIEGSGFFLGERTAGFQAGSGGTLVLSRPFFDNRFSPPVPGIQIVSSPMITRGGVTFPQTSGSIVITSPSRLEGGEVNGIFNLGHCGLFDWNILGPGRFDLLVGVRYLNLEESINIVENPTILSGTGAGTSFLVFDQFHTRNQFVGGQIGARREWGWRNWTLDVTGKLGLGSTHQKVDINGSTSINGGAPLTGGLLATSNIGSYSRDHFSFVPELGVNVGYQLTPRLRAFVGYNLLYWTDVARPGDQINLNINPTTVPRLGGATTSTGHLPGINNSDFWAQGVNFGLEFKY
jgi:hypothetical protein